MRKILSISILFLFIFINNSFAQQIKGFPNTSEKFINEFSQMLMKNATENKKEIKIFVDSLNNAWVDGSITEDMKSTVYSTANTLTIKRALPYPHYFNYIKSVYLFARTGHDYASYENWDRGIEFMVNNKKIALKSIDEFLEMTVGLLTNNSLYKSPTTEWRANSNNFYFKFDGTIKLIYGQTDLTCYAKQDSVQILKTKGVYTILEKHQWKGVNGTVTWERSGFNPNEVFANLNKYNINLTQSHYEADTVSFVHKTYFEEALQGNFEEKVMKITQVERATYPRFESFTKRFQLKNIYEGVDYDGGFSMEGAKFIGKGSKEEPAMLYIYKDGAKFLTAASKSYDFKKDQITGANTAVSIKIDKDSIYHPGLLFKYFVKKRNVELIRNGEGMSNSPFFNTYHKLTMDFENLVWNADDTVMVFKMMKGSSNTKATFESTNFFSESQYEKIQLMDEQNPLAQIKKYLNTTGTNWFYVSEFANFMRKDINMVRRTLVALTFKGLINYDFDLEEVTVKQRFYDYMSSHAGKIDYDGIDFVSNTEGQDNAKLNLKNFDLNILGVSEVFLSDSQAVALYPEDERITVKKNLNFAFDGKLSAGLFMFSGRDYYFDYDNFKINLNNVDSLRLKAETGEIDMYGNKQYKNVRTLIENIQGNLLIDAPNNKSGLKDFPQYPVFNSFKDSYVYYDRRAILEGAYSRDNFYFQIYPYTIDSLDNFTRKSLRFGGYFVSGGIFPPFENDLTLQPDFSLGFIKKTPPEGMALYGGKGTFVNDIKLSNEGLRGDGDFKYITSVTTSNDFIFFPDSMIAEAQKMHIEQQASGVQYPDVDAINVDVNFKPADDEYFTTKKEIPISMFNDQALHSGTLKLKPDGLTGWGKLDFNKAELTSEEFKFNMMTINADTSNFKLKAFEDQEFAFKTNNVNAFIDFEARKGEFVSNGAGSLVEFTQNQYICFMDQFVWYMDEEEIAMSSNKAKEKPQAEPGKELTLMEQEDIQLEGSEFVSIHPDQDSLKFVAPTAKFNMRKHIISATEVKYIRTADATVYLGDGKVTVEKGAKMNTLSNTKIIANNTTRYHTIYNATTNIFGKKSYSANGDYDYLDENNTKQKLHFDIVAVDSTIQTYAKGKINITENFTLSPNYSYTGDVNLFASNKFLTFDGSTKLAHNCEKFGNYWLKFKSEINPTQIFIPVDTALKDINNSTLLAGVIQTTDTLTMYSAFLTKHVNYSDIQVLPVSGVLYFDKVAKKYIISNKEKVIESNLPGNYLSLHKDVCSIYGEGKMTFGAKLGQVKTQLVGNVIHSYDTDIKDFDLTLALDFMFWEPSLKVMAEQINNDVMLDAVNQTRKTYEKAMVEILGKEVADNLKTEIYTYGAFKKLPKELEHTINFSDLKMTWNDKLHAFVSTGKIGVANILKTQVNKMVNGSVVVFRKRTGDALHIYLEIDKLNWYYFVYERGQMLALSSNNDFNNPIRDLKMDKRKMEVTKGQAPYQFYVLSNSRKKDNLLKMLNNEVIDETEKDE